MKNKTGENQLLSSIRGFDRNIGFSLKQNDYGLQVAGVCCNHQRRARRTDGLQPFFFVGNIPDRRE